MDSKMRSVIQSDSITEIIEEAKRLNVKYPDEIMDMVLKPIAVKAIVKIQNLDHAYIQALNHIWGGYDWNLTPEHLDAISWAKNIAKKTKSINTEQIQALKKGALQ